MIGKVQFPEEKNMPSNVEVTCPECEKTRIVKKWNPSWGGPPYVRLCKSCSQKNQSAETREKKRVALEGKPKPADYSERLKERHRKDPSLKEHLVPGAGAAWNRGTSTGPKDEETKKRISDSMKKRKRKDQ